MYFLYIRNMLTSYRKLELRHSHLLLILKTCFFYKTGCPNMEVNRTKPSIHSVSVPWYTLISPTIFSFYTKLRTCFFYKTGCPNVEVNRTKPSIHSVSVPWYTLISATIFSFYTKLRKISKELLESATSVFFYR